MPLILLCGYPCSGKSVVSKMLVERLQKQLLDHVIQAITEPIVSPLGDASSELDNSSQLIDPRIQIYSNPALEKQMRSQLKSEIELVLTGKLSEKAILVVDANNYLKSYRYELYCLAKSRNHPQAIIHCTTSHEQSEKINSQLNRYPGALFMDLVQRFEAPNGAARWDKPLYEVQNPFVGEAVEEIDSLVARIIAELVYGSGRLVKPNKSTLPQRTLPTNFLHFLDSSISSEVERILELPGGDGISASQWTREALMKAKRQFVAFIRCPTNQQIAVSLTSREEVVAMYWSFLNADVHKSAFAM